MNAFEYLSVLISIILALDMTRVLAGVGEMLQAGSRRHIYWVHVIWIVNLFLYLVVAWWIFYRWRNQQPRTFFLISSPPSSFSFRPLSSASSFFTRSCKRKGRALPFACE